MDMARLFGFGLVIVIIAAIGLMINLGSIVLLCRKKKPSHFHKLLKMLSIYDCLVVICCSISYGLPNLSTLYLKRYHPQVIQWIYPVSHIAVMGSVYCTVLISFERYVRICFFCQLRTTRMITPENFKFYIIALIVAPTLFYIPKFFEVRTEIYKMPVVVQEFNCTKLKKLFEQRPIILHLVRKHFIQNKKEEHMAELVMLGKLCGKDFSSFQPPGLPPEDIDLKEADSQEQEDQVVVNITRNIDVPIFKETALRKNPIYYKLYYVYLNTLCGTLVPLVSLLYLNISTVRTLKRIMSQEVDETPPHFTLRKSVSTDHISKLIEKPLLNKKPMMKDCGTSQTPHLRRSLSADMVFEALDELSPDSLSSGSYMYSRRISRFEEFEMKNVSFDNRKLLIRQNLFAEEIIKHPEVKRNRTLSNPVLHQESRLTHFSEGEEINRRKSFAVNINLNNPRASTLQQRRESLAARPRRFQRRSTLMTCLELSTENPLTSPQQKSPPQTLPEIVVTSEPKQPEIIAATSKEEPGKEEVEEESGKEKACKSLSVEDSVARARPAESAKGTTFSTHPMPVLRRHSGRPARQATRRNTEGGSLAPTLASQRSTGHDRAQERRLTRISISIVWLFLFCHAWKLIPTIYESIQSRDGLDHEDWPLVITVFEYMSHVFITLNSAVNFLIYLIM